MTLTEFTDTLQLLAHQGYALHDVEIHSKCSDCDSDIIISEPEFTITKDEKNKTIKIKFNSKE